MGNFVSEILFGYTTLISIINPLDLAFVFLNKTATLTPEERARLAYSVALNAMFLLLVTFFIGAYILHLFGISLEALRVAGGLSVAVSGWAMLNAPEPHPQAQALQQITPSMAREMVFFPLTMPLTTGPGTVAATIALSANRTNELRDFLLASLASVLITMAVAATVYLAYSRAGTLARYLGADGTRIVTRVSAFLLLCVGVQIMLTGLEQFLRPIIGHG